MEEGQDGYEGMDLHSSREAEQVSLGLVLATSTGEGKAFKA
jgi:hypothetical protein